jgi:hypothetical protein
MGVPIMFRTPLVAGLLCAAMAGCQSVPMRTSSAPVPEHTIQLFEEVAADREAVRQVVLRHVPPGTPIAQAQAMLEERGFTCRPYSAATQFFHHEDLIPRGVALPSPAYQQLARERKHRPVYCQARLPETQEWHLRSHTVLVVLVPDASQTVRDVQAGLGTHFHNNTAFFKARPELREPTGLSTEAAIARLRAAGFRPVDATGDRETRPHLICEAFDENPLGGQIVRVQLFPDEAGVIRETKVLDRVGLFDSERCMLPHGDEPTAVAIGRVALFPVRAGCGYALITVAVCMAITAMPYGLH